MYVRNRHGSIRTRMARATELYSDKPQYWPTRGDFIVRDHTLTLLANVARGVTDDGLLPIMPSVLLLDSY